MARPIEYNNDVVMNSAMHLFWRKGYEATSMKDLVEVTGLTTRSMYNKFGSKNGFFEACLQWYYENGAKFMIERLKAEDGLVAIRHFFEFLGKRRDKNGCMYVNTASDRENIDPIAINVIDDYFGMLEVLFAEKLAYAVEHEDYECDPSQRARELIIIIQGLSVYSKNLEDVSDNTSMIEGFLSLLKI